MPRPGSRRASVSPSPAPDATAAASTGVPSQHAGAALSAASEDPIAASAAAFTLEEKGKHFEVVGQAAGETVRRCATVNLTVKPVLRRALLCAMVAAPLPCSSSNRCPLPGTIATHSGQGQLSLSGRCRDWRLHFELLHAREEAQANALALRLPSLWYVQQTVATLAFGEAKGFGIHGRPQSIAAHSVYFQTHTLFCHRPLKAMCRPRR